MDTDDDMPMPVPMRIEAELAEKGIALDSPEAMDVARRHYREYVPHGVDPETVKVGDEECIEINARGALEFIAGRRN